MSQQEFNQRHKMKKRHSWWGRAASFAVNCAILWTIAYALSKMWQAPLLLTVIVATVLAIIFTLICWRLAEHPDEPLGAGYHPGKYDQ